MRYLLSLYVFLLHLAICASDEECDKCVDVIPCYQCSTMTKGEEYCEDPFNLSHNTVRKVPCKGACVKWVIKPKADQDFTHVVRSCYNDLDITFPAALVCMGESRPGYGHLCFCNTELCNGAFALNGHRTTHFWTLICVTSVALWFVMQYLDSGSFDGICRQIVFLVCIALSSVRLTIASLGGPSTTRTFRDDG
ncbi:protein quiver isoform X2 [Lingula anatina]|uniref:UPAR/Ly6 domain-containing protein qvr n=1 Tax=Lingula anatina TaxID=7574 RepID=A0A1S3K8Y4_LINAN|nr:protein quiver isoform X2 [Lingula anatina]|eukprot:XP_013418962.1 protein quiver isoform X2 [Lingula anatina]